MSLNKVILHGHLSKDVELRFANNGTAVASFSIACNHSFTNEAGEKKDNVTFVDVTAFGKRGETLAQYLKCGSPLLLEGRLSQDIWTDKATQQKRSKLKVILESFTFLGGKDGAADGRPAQSPRQTTAREQVKAKADDDYPPGAGPAQGQADEDDGVPF